VRPRPLSDSLPVTGRRKGERIHLLLATARLCPRDLGRLFRRLPEFLVGRDAAAVLHHATIQVAHNRLPLPHDPRKLGRVARTLDQRRGLIAYALKGLDPATADTIGVNAEDQGQVRFRRCGVARALDWTARRKAGWQEQALEAFGFADLGAKRRRALSRAAVVESPWGRSGAPQGADRPPPHPLHVPDPIARLEAPQAA
jgi:hypothetical protein